MDVTSTVWGFSIWLVSEGSMITKPIAYCCTKMCCIFTYIKAGRAFFVTAGAHQLDSPCQEQMSQLQTAHPSISLRTSSSSCDGNALLLEPLLTGHLHARPCQQGPCCFMALITRSTFILSLKVSKVLLRAHYSISRAEVLGSRCRNLPCRIACPPGCVSGGPKSLASCMGLPQCTRTAFMLTFSRTISRMLSTAHHLPIGLVGLGSTLPILAWPLHMRVVSSGQLMSWVFEGQCFPRRCLSGRVCTCRPKLRPQLVPSYVPTSVGFLGLKECWESHTTNCPYLLQSSDRCSTSRWVHSCGQLSKAGL